MSGDKMDKSLEELGDEALDNVAGGVRIAHGRCSVCGKPVDMAGVTLPYSGQCPKCGQMATIQ